MAGLVAGALLVALAYSTYAPDTAVSAETAPLLNPLPLRDRLRVPLTRDQQGQALRLGGFAQTPLSLLHVKSAMHYGDFIWNDKGIAPGPVAIRVDLRTQILSVFRSGHEIGTAIVLFGADAKQTPLGKFPVLWKGKNHRSSLYDAPMPFTLRLTGDGIAIHGSEVRWGAATHGCIGVPTEFARHLYGETKLGDPVVILRSTGAA